MKMKLHDFEIEGGKCIVKEKFNWLDCLNINIPCLRIVFICIIIIILLGCRQKEWPEPIIFKQTCDTNINLPFFKTKISKDYKKNEIKVVGIIKEIRMINKTNNPRINDDIIIFIDGYIMPCRELENFNWKIGKIIEIRIFAGNLLVNSGQIVRVRILED